MSVVAQQVSLAVKRNGAYPTTIEVAGKQVQCPLTSNFDVMTVGAYWFTRMREFFKFAELKFKVWTGYRRERPWHYPDRRSTLDTWSKFEVASSDAIELTPNVTVDGIEANTETGLLTPNINRYLAALDMYLALPGANMVDSERSDGSDRFTSMPLTSVQGAIAERIKLKDPRSMPDVGWLMTAYSNKQRTSDAIRGTYNQYIRNLVTYWDILIRHVTNLKSYILPRTQGGIPGEKFGDLKDAKAFWDHVNRIEQYMSANQLVLDSQLNWGDWVNNAGTATKNAAEQIIKEGSTLAGEGAAWAATQAGQAYGNFYSAFLSNVGLWGIAFVALMIYTR